MADDSRTSSPGHRHRAWAATLLAVLVLAVIACSPQDHNVAPAATVTASSANASAGQTPEKATDGVVGRLSNPGNQWVSRDGGPGTWIQLRWATPQNLDRVVLYDQLDDRDGITAGMLTFDDGTTTPVGALPNDGAPVTVTFSPHRTSTLRFTVDQVVPGTRAVGLAEIEAWTTEDPPIPSASIPALVRCDKGRVINIIAHPDDDLLFLSPQVGHDIDDGRCVRTVVVTAGDNGSAAPYWQGRAEGLRAAYSVIAHRENAWVSQPAVIAGGAAESYTLVGRPEVSLVFVGLPDGNLSGEGFPATGKASLQRLWEGDISAITTVDGTSTYTRQGLTQAVAQLITSTGADQIHTLDPRPGAGDHSDHRYVARLVTAAIETLPAAPTVTSYLGYPSSKRSANVRGDDLRTKKAAFYRYAAHDPLVCDSDAACRTEPYGQWLTRQYEVSR